MSINVLASSCNTPRVTVMDEPGPRSTHLGCHDVVEPSKLRQNKLGEAHVGRPGGTVEAITMRAV